MPKELTPLDALTTELSVPVVDDGEDVYPDVVEQAFQDLWNAVAYLRNRGIESIASVPALKALVTHADGHRRYLPGKGVYRYDSASNAAADDDLVLRPNDVAANAPGRWIRDAATSGELAALTARVVTLETNQGGPQSPVPSTATFPDPVGRYYGRSGVLSFGASCAEPFIVWDAAVSKYRMYRFNFTGAGGSAMVTLAHATADTLEGPWTDAGTFLSTYHKLAVLVDAAGNAVQLGGKYHGYAVYYPGQDAGKYIVHVEANALAGPWAVTGVVVPVGHAGATDNSATDAPFALYEGNEVHLYYMGMPSAQHATYGYAARMHYTKSAAPNTGFAFQSIVLNPSTTNGAWDYGWIGGAQLLKRPDGTWAMLYNASSTRPIGAASEPAPSLNGFATAPTLAGPWTRDPGNPYTSITDLNTGAVESTNNWRGFLVLDRITKKWYLYYNTGLAGTEKITFARQGVSRWQQGGAMPADVLGLTAAENNVPGSTVELPAGWYRVRAQYNLMGDGAGGLPKLDIEVRLKVNGVTQSLTRTFVGSYQYENVDQVVEDLVYLPARGTVRLSAQVVAGNPGNNARLRNLRLMVVQQAP